MSRADNATVPWILVLLLTIALFWRDLSPFSSSLHHHSQQFSQSQHTPRAQPLASQPLRHLRNRDELPAYLQELKTFRVGVEIGVQQGFYAKLMLKAWRNCDRYYLIDAWRFQQNYFDKSNVNQNHQNKLFMETANNLDAFSNRTIFLRMFSQEAVRQIIEPVDFVYVDARHDYCGCKEDMELYWPLIRSGGIMAGHDYLTAADAFTKSKQNWSVCLDGSLHEGAVKGAVNEFASARNLPIVVTKEEWPTWMIRKP